MTDTITLDEEQAWSAFADLVNDSPARAQMVPQEQPATANGHHRVRTSRWPQHAGTAMRP
ncbi:MAG: hypothetical protein M0Q42_03105 [Xanthomonadales bacterium]|nr:hypothetical protein [Xanthomonadales bacterium]